MARAECSLPPSTVHSPLSPSTASPTDPVDSPFSPALPTVPLSPPPTVPPSAPPPTLSETSDRHAGPTVPIPESPIDIFNQRISCRGYIVDESNRYAQQVMGQERFDKWTKITLPELQAYMRFMVINKLPCIEEYWRRDPSVHYAPIADRITRE